MNMFNETTGRGQARIERGRLVRRHSGFDRLTRSEGSCVGVCVGVGVFWFLGAAIVEVFEALGVAPVDEAAQARSVAGTNRVGADDAIERSLNESASATERGIGGISRERKEADADADANAYAATFRKGHAYRYGQATWFRPRPEPVNFTVVAY